MQLPPRAALPRITRRNGPCGHVNRAWPCGRSREEILAHACAQRRSNKGAPGVDGQDVADVEAYGVQRWLARRNEGYRTDPIFEADLMLSLARRIVEPFGQAGQMVEFGA